MVVKLTYIIMANSFMGTGDSLLSVGLSLGTLRVYRDLY